MDLPKCQGKGITPTFLWICWPRARDWAVLFDHSLLLQTCFWSVPLAVIRGFKVSSFPQRKSNTVLVLVQDAWGTSTHKDLALLCVCQLCRGKNGDPAPGLTGENWVGKKGAKAAQCWQTPAGTILLSVSSRCCLTVLHFALLSIPRVSCLRSTNGTDPRLAESPAKPLSQARDVLLERQLCCRQGKGPDPNPTEIFSRI